MIKKAYLMVILIEGGLAVRLLQWEDEKQRREESEERREEIAPATLHVTPLITSTTTLNYTNYLTPPCTTPRYTTPHRTTPYTNYKYSYIYNYATLR